MGNDKKGFLLYNDQKELFDKLSNKKAGELIKHIFAYANEEDPVAEDFLIEIAFTSIKQQMIRDTERYNNIKEKRSQAGKASGESRRKKTSEENTEQKPMRRTKRTNVKSVKQTSTKRTIIDKDIDKDNNIKKKINKKDFYSKYSFFKRKFAKRWFDEYIPLKKRKKASITDRQLNFQLKTISKLSKDDYTIAFEILNKSINSGWTDFYPLNGSFTKSKPSNSNGSHNTSLKKQKFTHSHKTV